MSPVRKNPAARELDRLEREAAANLRAAALKQQQQNDTIESSKAEIAELKKMAVTKEKKHTKEVDNGTISRGWTQKKSSCKMMTTTKRNRGSPSIYGQPFVEACFGDIVEGFTCDVNGEEEITPFEKYSTWQLGRE